MVQLFSVPIFFVVFRETVEAAIIVSVLLSFVEQLMSTGRLTGGQASSSVPSLHNFESDTLLEPATDLANTRASDAQPLSEDEESAKRVRQLIKRMRWQIWAGTIGGFVVALAIGAAFIAVFYTKVVDLWGKTEQIWEGAFSLVACIVIYLMGVAFLKMDRSRVKWRIKLASAFEKSHSKAVAHSRTADGDLAGTDAHGEKAHVKEGISGKWALFLLPFITVLREGLEAVVFVGGVSLGIEGTSIPIPAIVGLIAGGVVGYIIYRSGSTASLHWFLVASTSFLFLIGAGLASKSVGFFEYYRFSSGVGGDVGETGDGPGSYMVAGNVWHLTYGNPETGSPSTNGGWQLFNALFGWNNTATVGSVLAYVFYWIVVGVTLVYLKWKEGRATCLGIRSKALKDRDARHANMHESKRSSPSFQGADAPMESPELKKGSDDGDRTGGEERVVPELI